MGYHLIIRHTDQKIESFYAETEEDLTKYEIKETSIIYQGDKHWTPIMVKDSERFKSLAMVEYRMGIQAQILFKKQALEKKLILEELSQDQESFKAYTGISDDFINVKRGDFLIRNVFNFEVDVKCRKLSWNKNKNPCFNFSAEHLIKHEAMMKFTNTPIIIAFYQHKDHKIITDSLKMMDIGYMRKYVKRNNLIPEVRKKGKKDQYSVYEIPIEDMMDGFKLITCLKSKYQEKIADNK